MSQTRASPTLRRDATDGVLLNAAVGAATPQAPRAMPAGGPAIAVAGTTCEGGAFEKPGHDSALGVAVWLAEVGVLVIQTGRNNEFPNIGQISSAFGSFAPCIDPRLHFNQMGQTSA